MQKLWWRRAIEQRLGTLAAAAILLWTLGTAIAASLATGQIADSIAEDRRVRAQAIASRLDVAIQEELRQLDAVAAAGARGSADLSARVRSLNLADAALRLDVDGRVLWTRDVREGEEVAPIIHQLPVRLSDRHISATGRLATNRGSRVFLIVPVPELDSIGGGVAAAVDVAHGAIGGILTSYAKEPYRVVLAGENAVDIGDSRADTTASRTFGLPRMLTATSQLATTGWQLRLEQLHSEALAPIYRLRRILIGSSLLLIPFAVLVAWATARSIRQPVLAMTDVAESLARGEFAAPVPPAGEDEIGRLADALEKLRHALEADERRSLLLKRVISAQEEERRRIARELHDQTTQQLTALKMQLGSATRPDPQTADLLTRSQALVGAMIDDVHRLIYDLRPSMLDDLGLLPAIRAYAERRLVATGVEVHCEFPPDIPQLTPEATTALYRVVQEALTNIARHARAETVLIGCTVSAAQITLEIEDDGIGFDPTKVATPRENGEGLGLLGMRERLALLGGRVDVTSEHGRGAHVVVVLPLPSVAEGRAA